MIKSSDDRDNSSISRRIFRNFTFLTTGKFLGDVFTFLMFVTISRVFGQEGIGEYSFAMALTSFFMILADFGLTNQSILEMSRQQNRVLQYYSQILAIRLFLITSILFLLFVLSSHLSISERGYQIMLLVGSYQVLYTLLDGVGSIFIAGEKMQYKGLIEFSSKSTSALLCMTVIWLSGGLTQGLMALPAVVIVHVIISHYLVVKKLGPLTLQLNFLRSLRTLKQSASFAGYALLQQIGVRIDIVLLGLLIGASAVGTYNVAYRFLFLLLFLPYFASLSIFPLASRLHATARDELEKLYRTTVNLTILLGLPVAAGVWLIAPDVIMLIFGEDFSESAFILRILAVVLFLSFFNRVIGIFLAATDAQGRRTKNQAICAVTYAIGNVILIPMYGPPGAAFAAIVAETVLSMLTFRQLNTRIAPTPVFSRLLISTLGVAAFCVPLSICKGVPFALDILFSILIYLVCISMFRTIRDGELALAYALIRGRES